MRRSLLSLPFCALLLGLAPQEEPPTFADAFADFVALVEAGAREEAVAFAEPWLEEPNSEDRDAKADEDAEGETGATADGATAATDDGNTDPEAPVVRRESLGERERAAFFFGLGLVRGRSDDSSVWSESMDDFLSARALAGPGALRLDATYNAGVVELQEAERLRAQIPEIAGQGAAPQVLPPPGAAGVPGAAPAEAEDPLPLARAAYERARATLSERLRADWRDVDTRANLELIQRRLRELDDIERRREEQEQEQQEQDPSEDQEGQDQEQDQEGQDGEEQLSQEDPEGEDAQPNEEQEQEGEEGESGEEEQEPPPELEQEEQGQEPQGSQLQDEERHLTREEVMRLLDRLEELEEQGREVEAALRRGRRTPVERDW